MNKRILLLGLILVIILGAAFFFLLPKSSPLPNGNMDSQNSSGGADLFTQAYTGGDSAKCSFTQDGSIATAYIKQGKIRFDSMGTDGVAFGNAIIDGNMVYIWQAGNNQGVKFDITDYQGENAPAGGILDSERIRTEIENHQAECVKEEMDDEVFIPPSAVTFTDAAQFPQQPQQPVIGAPSAR